MEIGLHQVSIDRPSTFHNGSPENGAATGGTTKIILLTSRRRHLPTLIATLALAVGGCASRQDVRAPRTALPAAYEVAGPRGELSTASLDRWWTLFEDAQLTDLIDRALESGFDAKLALARLAEARAIRAAALSRFRVQGDLVASATTQKSDVLAGEALPFGLGGGNIDSATANFNVSWEADLFGRQGATRRAAEADLAAARFVYEGARAALAAEVADTLFAGRSLAVQRNDARETVRLQRRLASNLRIRAGRGLGADADVARVDADVAQAEAVIAQLDAELQASARAILVLTGRGTEPIAGLMLAAELGNAPTPPSTLPGDLVARRPDVREAEARLRAASARTDLQRLELFPRLTLNPGVGLSAQGGDFSITSLIWTLGLGIAVPVLDRPRLLAELNAQGARAEQAVVEYERSVQRGFAESEGALVRLEADQRRVLLLSAGERRARVSFDAAQVRFSRGLEDLTAVLDAERTWRTARQSLTGARVDALRRSVQAFRALGGGWASGERSLALQAVGK